MTSNERSDDGGLAHVWNVLQRMTADDLHAVCRDLTVGEVSELARVVGVPRVVLSRDSSADHVLRNRIRQNETKAKLAVDALVRPTRDLAIDALGSERSAEPGYDDLVEVLPGLIDRHGPRRVALLLAFAIDDRWAAAEPSRQLLDTDERFGSDALGPLIDDDVAPKVVARPPGRSEPRSARKSRAKSSRAKAATPRGRPSYKRKRAPDASESADPPVSDDRSDPPPVTVNGRALDPNAHHRRDVRIVGSYRALDRFDPLVGRIVLADVVFDGPIAGGKVRPCVVIAASGVDDLVVRPCYSEGARRAGDFRAVPVSDPDVAGLDRTSFVSHEERCVPRAAVAAELGWLSYVDWNQL